MRNTKTDRLTESTSVGEITSLSPWQRIEAIIRHYRFPSISAFARELGLRRAENLFQIKKGNNRLSIGLADTISVKYPQLNKIWILTGEGEMFSGRPNPEPILDKIVAVPYYNNFPFNKPPDKPDKMLYCSREFASDGGFAAMCRDDALYPLLKRGSVLILSELKGILELIYGEVYFVETKTLGIFRIVRRNMENDGLILQALHPDKYDDMKIDQANIKALYKIHTTITML